MKNFKKLFAVAASVMMLASTLPAAVLGASYSDELEGAYDYAYGIGITTQSSIDNANMYGTLIRSHMAKMMVNYAKEVLGKTADTSLDCEFTDVANQSEELQGYITEACQLGLMGQGVTAFNPNGLVTRAQFGTVLSRALYGDTYNGGDPYYADHLAALKDAGIMNNISNPNALEVRGYVMLMMQRAAGADQPEICSTPENVLSCSLGLDTCPAQCQTNNTVKEGTLSLSSIGVDYTSIPQAGLVSFGKIKLTAGGSDITVNSIKIKKLGLSDISTATKVYFEKDGTRISSKTSFDTTTKIATVTFTTPLLVKSSETIDVIMSLSGVSANADIQIASTDVNSTAADVNGSFSSATFRTSDYAVVGINSNLSAGNITQAKVDETKLVELGQIKIAKTWTGSSTRAVNVTALTLNTSGVNTATLSYLSDVALYRDEVKVSTKTIIGTRTISFILNDEIKTTQTSDISYVVKWKITTADRVGDKYSFYLKNTEDLTVLEKDTGFRAVNNVWTANMGVVTIIGGDLRLNEKTVSALNVVPGAKNVVFYDGSFQTIEPITLDTLQNIGALVANGSGIDKILDNLYVKIGNSVISVDAIPTTSGSSTMKFEWQVTVNGTVPFMIYGDIKSDAPATSISFMGYPIGTTSFLTKEDANGDAVSVVGSIGGRKATIAAADLTLSNSSASTKSIQRGDRNVLLANLEFGTTSDVTSRLYSFHATAGGTGRQLFDGAQVTVYNEAGTALVSDVIDTGASWDGVFVLPNYLPVSKGNPVKLTVKLDQVPNAVNAPDKYLQLTFTGVNAKEIINQNSVWTSLSTTSTLLRSVVGGSADVVTQSYTNTLAKYGTLATIGNVKIKAINADVVLKDVYFTLSGLTDLSKISSAKLFEDNVEIATLVPNGNVLYYTNLNKTIVVGINKTYEVKANISPVNTNADVLPTFVTKLSTGTFESTYGNTLTPLTGKVISNTIKVVNEIPTITAVDGYTKGNDVVYKITLNSTKEVDLSGLTLSVNGTNLTGGLSGTTAYLAPSDINYTTTNYTTANVAGTTLTFGGLAQGAVTIPKVIYVVLKNAALLANTNGNTSTVRVAATDMDYMDIFADDNSANLNAGMLYNYFADIAGTLDLLKVVTIQ